MTFAKNSFLQFILVFAAVFLICYFGALFITGLAVPGGMYSPFVEKYFNLSAWLRSSLIGGTKLFVAFFNIETIRTSDYVLSIPGYNGIRIVYSCLGFGVMSFWTAYIIATAAKKIKKISWLIIGLLLIWIINVIRISMVLLAGYKGWKFPLGLDHHTWFNIIAYLAIFIMMYFFEKNIKKSNLHEG
jgi:exosortase/archaeosortase family protein